MVAKRRSFSGLVALSLALAWTGCGKPAAQPQAVDSKASSIEVQIEAGAKINLSPAGEPLSVVVRMYQLKELDELKRLTFEKACYDKTGAEFFGQDFVKESTVSEFSVVPGSSKIQVENLQPSTQYLAVIALFRQPDANFWRVVVQAKDLRVKTETKSKGLFGRVGDAVMNRPAEPKGASASGSGKPGRIQLKVHENYIEVEGANRVLLPGQPESGKPQGR